MARRSDYPFHKSDLKFGTNLIATLFSIPISLGARAVIDGSKDLLSTYPTDTAKLPSEATQGKIGRLEFAIGVVVLILLFILGIYWTSLPIVGFLGVGFAILWLVLLVFFISAFVVQNVRESKINKDIEVIRGNYIWMDIDDYVQNILHQSLNVEMFFHFTRPLLTEAEYMRVESERFKKNLKSYQDYKEAWNRFYWNYSFQVKVSETLKEAVYHMMERSHVMSEPDYCNFVHKSIKSKLNHIEKGYYENEVQTIQSIEKCFAYTFVLNKILPYKDNEKELSRRFAWDFQNRREILLKEIYKQYGGTWKPELLNQLEVWSCI